MRDAGRNESEVDGGAHRDGEALGAAGAQKTAKKASSPASSVEAGEIAGTEESRYTDPAASSSRESSGGSMPVELTTANDTLYHAARRRGSACHPWGSHDGSKNEHA